MSIPVDVAQIPERLADFDRGYLLTSRDGLVKAVSVRAVAEDGGLLVRAPGGGSLRNIGANPSVTLLFPPLPTTVEDVVGMSLLIDGTATVEGDDVRLSPASAVLHKPASTEPQG